MDNSEFEKRLAENGKNIEDLRNRIENAFQINQMQKTRLITYANQLMTVQAEQRSIQKQLLKKPFSLKNLFKKN